MKYAHRVSFLPLSIHNRSIGYLNFEPPLYRTKRQRAKQVKMTKRSPWSDENFRTTIPSGPSGWSGPSGFRRHFSNEDLITLLQKHEESLLQSVDQKLDLVVQTVTAKLDAMMEEIRSLPGGTDYVEAMQRLHGATEELDQSVLAGAASASGQ